jgi:hypothetical protein
MPYAVTKRNNQDTSTSVPPTTCIQENKESKKTIKIPASESEEAGYKQEHNM